MVVVRRLGPGDEAVAREMFEAMASVFEDGGEPVSKDRLTADDVASLLRREDFWALAAIEDDVTLGGITAHALPMTRSRSTELFLYDLAVRTNRQRRGIGRALVTELLSLARAARIQTTFVAADNEDAHAVAFYRAVGGAAASVTFFTFES